MRDYPDLPLPEPFHWDTHSRHLGGFDLRYGPYDVATCWADGDGWRARVAILWADELQREAVAESESQARFWCVKWAMREIEKIRITRPLTAGFSYGPDVFSARNAQAAPPASTWTAEDESARRKGRKRGRPGPRLSS